MAEKDDGEDRTNPNGTKLATDGNQISFTSISSSESGLDVMNTSQDTVDTGPLRIKRMPLLGHDYVDKRKASVENLLGSKTNDQMVSKGGDTIDNVGDGTGTGSFENVDDQSGKSRRLHNSNPCDLSSTMPMYSFLETKPPPVSKPPGLTLAEGEVTYCPIVTQGDEDILTIFDRSAKRARIASDSLRHKSPLYEEPEIDFDDMDDVTSYQNTPDEFVTNDSPDHQPLMQANGRRQSVDHVEVRDVDMVDSGLYRPEKKYLPDNVEYLDAHGDDVREYPPLGPICTPPKLPKPSSQYESSSDVSNAHCGSPCCSTFCALFKPKHVCSRFSIFDIFLTLGSVGMYIFDVSTDLILSLTYYRKIGEHYSSIYFGLTLGFVAIPSIIVQIFSFIWVIHDFRSKKKQLSKVNPERSKFTGADCLTLFFQLILHIFQLAILYRYFRAFFYGWKSRQFEVAKKETDREHFDQLWRYEMFDVNILRLLESVLESAPQLILQIYIILMTKEVFLLTVISCVASLVALSSMMVSIQRAIRNSDDLKKQLSIPASAVMFCWRACTISSRVVAFALFLTIQPWAFLVFVLLHWMLSTVWIAVRKTYFCGSKKCAEYLFDGVCGLIYIFCFLNVHSAKKKEKVRMRYRMLVFYTVVMGENSVLSILWYFFRPGGDTRVPTWDEISAVSMWNGASGSEMAKLPSDTTDFSYSDMTDFSLAKIPVGYALAVLVAVHGLFILGMLFMVTYYILLHPSRTSGACCCQAEGGTREYKKDPFLLVSEPLNGSGEKIAQHLTKAMTPTESLKSVVRVSSPPTVGQAAPGRQGSALDLAKRQFSDDSTWPGDARRPDIPKSLTYRRRMPRKEQRNFSSTPNSDEDSENSELRWSSIMFDRKNRAARLYTRQYSRENILEESEESSLIAGMKEGIGCEARQTDRFKATVTPTRDKPATPPTAKHDAPSPIKHERQSCPLSGTHPPFRPSILIRPGSRQSGVISAPRSATHQGPLSTALVVQQIHSFNIPTRPLSPLSLNASPVKNTAGRGKHPAALLKQAQSRDYSASMSCLMGGRPLTHMQRRGLALGQGVSRAPSFTLTKNEILESIESSV